MNDTICAIATPFGSGAISIIRVSGKDAIEKVNKIFKGKNLCSVPSHSIVYGRIVLDDRVIDEVMVSVMKGARSFTAEDSVEINCHGGIFVTKEVLKALLKQDIRLAEPGEFSKRAFLNGRIDLVQAESIMDMISAKSKMALDIANNGISKKISNMIKNLKDKVTDLIVNIDVNIDYPEYTDEVLMTNDLVLPIINSLINEMKNILEKSKSGKLIREGIKTSIVGRPNVGKSSLLNALLEEEKAIVSDIPGTTRDLVEGYINLGGVTLNLIDTAGIRDTSDVIEQIGVNRSKNSIDNSDIVLVVLDGSSKLTEEDLSILEMTKDKKRIIISNKNDLKQNNEYPADIYLSTKNQTNFYDLEKKIKEILELNTFDQFEMNYLSNVRHISLLENAYRALNDALDAINNGLEIDMVEIDLRQAFNYLGEIVGDNSTEFLVDTLFSRFCLGK